MIPIEDRNCVQWWEWHDEDETKWAMSLEMKDDLCRNWIDGLSDYGPSSKEG